MRFAVVSVEGVSLSWWARLQDEGHDVAVFINPPKGVHRFRPQQHVGHGIVDKLHSWAELDTFLRVNPRETVLLFDCSGFGDRADEYRKKGFLVVGGGSFMDKMEQKRDWAERAIKTMGIHVPRSDQFSSLSDANSWLKKHGGEKWYFKSNRYLEASTTYGAEAEYLIKYLEYVKSSYGDNISCILQEKIKGPAISTAAWWNGNSFVRPFEGTIEHKKLLTGEIGPATGCQLNVVWFYENTPKIAEKLEWNTLEMWLRKEEAPPGLYDINAVISKKDGLPYFLEWTPRMGYDSEPTSQRLIEGDLGRFLYNLATGQAAEVPATTDEAATAIRLAVPSYPFEHLDLLPTRKTCIGLPVDGIDGLWDGRFVAYGIGMDGHQNVVKDPYGLVGLSVASGTDLEALCDETLSYAKELPIPNLMYRTDAFEVLSKDLAEIHSLGYKTAFFLE